jgi:pyruvate dehydrogenase E1 component alpha subunit
MEGLNLAGIWKLPVVFICENNGYAETTSPQYSVSGQDIAARARGFGMPSVAIDGLDVFSVYEAVREAVARARRGDGPSFIETQTYRYYGHFEGDTIRYRNKEEEERYRNQDCIQRFRKVVVSQGSLTEAELDAIDAKAKQAIEEAVTFADASPTPQMQEVITDVYVNFPQSDLWPFQTVPN